MSLFSACDGDGAPGSALYGAPRGDGARDGAPQPGAATHPPAPWRQTLNSAAKVRGAHLAAALGGLEARATYGRPRVNVTQSNTGLARRCEKWATRREALLRRERGVQAAKELEDCTFTPKLNAHSLWIDADRASSTGEPLSSRGIASAPPSAPPPPPPSAPPHLIVAHPCSPRHLRRAAADRGPAPDGHTRRVAPPARRVRGCRGGGAARGRGAAAVLVQAPPGRAERGRVSRGGHRAPVREVGHEARGAPPPRARGAGGQGARGLHLHAQRRPARFVDTRSAGETQCRRLPHTSLAPPCTPPTRPCIPSHALAPLAPPRTPHRWSTCSPLPRGVPSPSMST